jgi:hypothetical protein
MAAKRSSLAEYPAMAVDGCSHVEALSSALAAFGAAARKGIDQANELDDLDTADLFTEISRGIDKWRWFVEAHLQAEWYAVSRREITMGSITMNIGKNDTALVLTDSQNDVLSESGVA